jgi:hypothetical protein
VIDKEICKIISDTRIVTRSEALEHGGAVLHHVGPRDDEDGLSRNADVHAGQLLVRVAGGG